MKVEEIISLMRVKPYLIRMGKGKLSKRLHCSPRDIEIARRKVSQPYFVEKKLPKILIFDVETAPMKAYVWNRWNQNISLDATISEWFMIAWSAKWLFSDETMGDVLTPFEAKNEDDSRIVQTLWQLIDRADIIVAHNGKRADVPWINTRFIVNGLNPPSPYHLIDTCEIAKKQFGFSSNKLDALAGYFGIPHKYKTDFQLWKDCLDGVQESLQYMLEYNKKDTEILEEVYLKLRPWIKNHPNCGNLISSEVPICCACGSEHLELIPDKYYYTSIGKYQLFRCTECGAITRGRLNLNFGKNKVTNVGR